MTNSILSVLIGLIGNFLLMGNTALIWQNSPLYNSLSIKCDSVSYQVSSSTCDVNVMIAPKLSESTCTEDSFVWTVKLFKADEEIGQYYFSGKAPKPRIIKNLHSGLYTIVYEVSDKCGNTAKCSSKLDIIPAVPRPTAIKIASALTRKGKVLLYARDFLKGFAEEDNCYEESIRLYTFYESHPVTLKIGEEHYFEGQGILSTKEAFELGQAQIWVPRSFTSGKMFGCNVSDCPKNNKYALTLTVWNTFLQHNSCTATLEVMDKDKYCRK